jgi:hypothetical protein
MKILPGAFRCDIHSAATMEPATIRMETKGGDVETLDELMCCLLECGRIF